ncbi:hypothetical protein BT69DRAFT_1086777 [Atractiella rhizophila]|nr:hypothetical protein BT69DRAFT_1086777 [Atractiella rhizophila]
MSFTFSSLWIGYRDSTNAKSLLSTTGYPYFHWHSLNKTAAGRWLSSALYLCEARYEEHVIALKHVRYASTVAKKRTLKEGSGNYSMKTNAIR